MLFKLLKLLFFLAILGFIALVGYAYFGDLSPDTQDRNQPVSLDGQ